MVFGSGGGDRCGNGGTEKGEGSGDEDDAREGDERGQLLRSGEGVFDQDVADVACQHRGQKGDDCCFGQGEVHHGVPHPVDAELYITPTPCQYRA